MRICLDLHSKHKKGSHGRREREDLFLLSRGKRSSYFVTQDSARYISFEDIKQRQCGRLRVERTKQFDSVLFRYQASQSRQRVWMEATWSIQRSFFGLRSRMVDSVSGFSFNISPVRAWNFSIVGAILFGMVSMSMIYRSFGQVASAEREAVPIDGSVAGVEISLSEREGSFLEEAIEFIQKDDAKALEARRLEMEHQQQETQEKERLAQEKREQFESQIREMVQGYPIESMLPAIFKQDDIVAAYLIAIAKKESNWGRRVPVLNGEDCYNYWGYRGYRDRMGSGGHTCFDSPEDAVSTVGARIAWFVHQKGKDNPGELVVWKCGFSCAGHDDYSVQKWIRDVDLYFSKLYTPPSEGDRSY